MATADPFATIRPLSIADLNAVASAADVAATLQQPFTDEPEFDTEANPEIKPGLGLASDRAFVRAATRRLFVDYRSNPNALKHLRRLPKEGESLHAVICGKYALFDLVPAIIERTKQPIAELFLVTLGFSTQNGADLCAMLDDRQIRKATLVCSHYFSKTSPNIYDAVIPELLKRRQRVLAMRIHAKMIVARMADGTRYSVESSANLRSNHNVETFVMTRCHRLHAFHRRWLETELCRHAHAEPRPAALAPADESGDEHARRQKDTRPAGRTRRRGVA